MVTAVDEPAAIPAGSTPESHLGIAAPRPDPEVPAVTESPPPDPDEDRLTDLSETRVVIEQAVPGRRIRRS
jgi:hypothetical protein